MGIFYKSLNRPFTTMGANSSLFIFFTGVLFLLALTSRFNPIWSVLAFVLWLLVLSLLRRLNRIDPQILEVYRRYSRYKSYYAALPGVNAKVVDIYDSVP